MSNSTFEPPHKRRKTSPATSPLSSLPEEMTLSCLARVSRSDQAALSLVSSTYRSLMASPELYKTRSMMGFTENCIYVCLLIPPNPFPQWFILRRGKTTNRLVRSLIPSIPFQPTEASSVVAIDWGIYVIGGSRNRKRTSRVFLLDCRTHTWTQAPSMGVARSAAAAGVVDGKTYVFGGCRDPDYLNWAEVFDPKTQTWCPLPPFPDREIRLQYIHDSVVVKEDKIYSVDGKDRTLYYSPSEGNWGIGNETPEYNKRDWCVIDKLIYACGRKGDLWWCEPDELECKPEGMCWRKVMGLDSLKNGLTCSRLVHFHSRLEASWESQKIAFGGTEKLIDLLPGFRLSNVGGNILLFWDVIEGEHLEIWCAEISLERRKGPEIWGNIERSQAVMTVDPFLNHYKVLHSVSVTL